MFHKGQKKVSGSGIKKGGKHKATIVRESVKDILNGLGINVVHHLLNYLHPDAADVTNRERIKILMFLMEYSHPKPRDRESNEDCPKCKGSDINLNLNLQSIINGQITNSSVSDQIPKASPTTDVNAIHRLDEKS